MIDKIIQIAQLTPEEQAENLYSAPESVNLIPKDFAEKKDLNALRTEIKTLQEQIDASTAPLGLYTGYVVMGAIIFTLLSIILLVVIINSRINSVNSALRSDLKEQKDKIFELKTELLTAQGTIGNLKNKIENLDRKSPPVPKTKTNFENENELISSPYVARVNPPPPPIQLTKNTISQPAPQPPPPPPTLLEKCKDFISDCNNLSKEGNMVEVRASRDEFLAKYKIQGFNCKNTTERINNPTLAPVFETTKPVTDSDYWAYEVENDTFAVIPNVKNYTENHHTTRAMGEVFNSNFEGGNYAKIRVVKPAIFKGVWQFSESGELLLS